MLNFYHFQSEAPIPWSGETIFTAKEDCKKRGREGYETRPFVFEFDGDEENKTEIIKLIESNCTNLILNLQSSFEFRTDKCADYLCVAHEGVDNKLYTEKFQLHLKDMTITPAIASSLAKVIRNKNCPKGFCLFFYQCNFTEESIYLLAQGIDEKDTIDNFTLLIDKCNLDNSLASIIFERIGNFPKDFILSLCSNKINAEGILPLAKSLDAAKRQLRFTLDLRSNPVSDKGAACIFQAIRQSKTLQTLNLGLSKTGLTDVSLLELIDLCNNWNENFLYLKCILSRNKAMTGGCIDKMISAMKRNFLIEMDLSCSPWNYLQCPALEQIDLLNMKNRLLQHYPSHKKLIKQIATECDLHASNFSSNLKIPLSQFNGSEFAVADKDIPFSVKMFKRQLEDLKKKQQNQSSNREHSYIS